MPWHISENAPGCSGWAVVKNDTAKIVGCHKTRADAEEQLAALYANVKELSMQTELARAVDNSPWDGNAAMSSASSAADYRSICAGHTSGDPDLRSTWKLPHHARPGAPPNAAGVRAALQRFSQTQGLTDATAARAHLEAHMKEINPERDVPDPPREIVRALADLELREPDGDGSIGLLRGYMAVFDEWAEVDSVFEGHFMERVGAGSFLGTIERDRERYRALYEHGKDPNIGRKPLGPAKLGEDVRGAWYEVPLLDTDYNRSLLPGLKQGLYGSSFRGEVRAEDFNKLPDPSLSNPDRLPERTIREMALMDFGPCPFPQYVGAVATARSMTDEYILGTFTRGEGLARLAEYAKQAKPIEVRAAPEVGRTEPPTTDTGAEEKPPEEKPLPTERIQKEAQMDTKNPYRSPEELITRQSEVKARQGEIARDHPAGGMSEETKAEWNLLKAEDAQLETWKAEVEEIQRTVAEVVKNPGDRRGETIVTDFQVRKPVERDIYDPVARRNAASSPVAERDLLRDDARRATEIAHFPHEKAQREFVQGHVESLVMNHDDRLGSIAQRVLSTGSPVYKRAFGKALTYQPLTNEEATALARPLEIERALSLTGASGGFAVPFELDPTIIPTSNFSVNPYRAIGRVVPVTVDEWRGVSSAGITAAFAAEATEAGDNAPTLVQPTISTEKAQAFVPFSIEVGMDWGSLQAEMARLLQDAKDDLEATKFTLGSGTNEPFGLITGATTLVITTTTAAFVVADLYKLEEALPPRYRPRAAAVANRFIYNKVRQFDTAGGSGVWLEAPGLAQLLQTQAPTPGGIGQKGPLGYAGFEASAMDSVLTTGSEIMVLGDFSRFVIIDRIGMTIEPIQHLVGTNHRPTGQRGLYCYWRVSSKVVDVNGFRTLQT